MSFYGRSPQKDILHFSGRNMGEEACILIVDDEPELRNMVRMILERAGYQVALAENGLLGLKVFYEQPVDLVLLDVMMPVLDGVETCRRIRQCSNIPIIFLTALGDEENLLAAFEAGAYDYVEKPFRPRELVARIQATLQRSPARVDPPSRQAAQPQRLVYEDLELDLRTRQVHCGGNVLDVTPLSF